MPNNVCPRCGALVPVEDRFCGECGSPVEEVLGAPGSAEPAAAPPSPPAARRARGTQPFLLIGGLLLLLAVGGGAAYGLGWFSPAAPAGPAAPAAPGTPGGAPAPEERLLQDALTAGEGILSDALNTGDASRLDLFFTGPLLGRLTDQVRVLRFSGQRIERSCRERGDWSIQIPDGAHAHVTVREVWSATTYNFNKVTDSYVDRTVIQNCDAVKEGGVWKFSQCAP